MKTRQNTLTEHLVLVSLAVTVVATVDVGCNTAKSFGKDVENAGKNTEDRTNLP
jgi:predicted small secreted protein